MAKTGIGRAALGLCAAAGLAGAVCVDAAVAGEAEAQALVAAAQGRILSITWSPVNILRLVLARDGRMSVIGTGLHHCSGPHPGEWRIEDGRLCLSTPWSAPCFDVEIVKDRYVLRERSDRALFTAIDKGPLLSCPPPRDRPDDRL